MNTTSTSCNTVAEALGLGTIADGDESVDPKLLRDVYRYVRGDFNNRTLFQNDPTFSRGWCNLESPVAKKLVSSFVALDDAENIKHARQMAQSNLEAQPWNDILHIESPPIQCRIKIHGNRWGMRFQSADARMRGEELVNEQLPGIADEPVYTIEATTMAEPAIPGTRMPKLKPSEPLHSLPDSNETGFPPEILDVLRKGGMTL